jgi:hypothetical protein
MEDKMGGECSTRGAMIKIYKKFYSENLKERGHSEGLGVDGRIILELILEK